MNMLSYGSDQRKSVSARICFFYNTIYTCTICDTYMYNYMYHVYKVAQATTTVQLLLLEGMSRLWLCTAATAGRKCTSAIAGVTWQWCSARPRYAINIPELARWASYEMGFPWACQISRVHYQDGYCVRDNPFGIAHQRLRVDARGLVDP